MSKIRKRFKFVEAYIAYIVPAFTGVLLYHWLGSWSIFLVFALAAYRGFMVVNISKWRNMLRRDILEVENIIHDRKAQKAGASDV